MDKTENTLPVERVGDAIQQAWNDYPFGLPPIDLTRAERDALAEAAIAAHPPSGLVEALRRIADAWDKNADYLRSIASAALKDHSHGG